MQLLLELTFGLGLVAMTRVVPLAVQLLFGTCLTEGE